MHVCIHFCQVNERKKIIVDQVATLTHTYTQRLFQKKKIHMNRKRTGTEKSIVSTAHSYTNLKKSNTNHAFTERNKIRYVNE